MTEPQIIEKLKNSELKFKTYSKREINFDKELRNIDEAFPSILFLDGYNIEVLCQISGRKQAVPSEDAHVFDDAFHYETKLEAVCFYNDSTEQEVEMPLLKEYMESNYQLNEI